MENSHDPQIFVENSRAALPRALSGPRRADRRATVKTPMTEEERRTAGQESPAPVRPRAYTDSPRQRLRRPSLRYGLR